MTLRIADVNALVARDRDLQALRATVAKQLSSDPGHDLAHAMRVALWTLRLGRGRIVRRDAVAAALCHDLVNLPKHSARRAEASTLSADLARRLLRPLRFSRSAIESIAAAIRDHSYSRGATPSTLLGRCLQDADRLEALGAVGVLRVISTGTQMGARYFDPEDPWAVRRRLDDRAYSLDHFFTKLLRLSETMCTAAGRAEARRRTRVMEAFLHELSAEIAVPRPRTKAHYRR